MKRYRPLATAFSRTFATVFKDKQAQIGRVLAYVDKKGMIPKEQVKQEVHSFYENLGIDDMYFQDETDQGIADNIIALYGSKIRSWIRKEEESSAPMLNLKRQTDSGAIYVIFND